MWKRRTLKRTKVGQHTWLRQREKISPRFILNSAFVQVYYSALGLFSWLFLGAFPLFLYKKYNYNFFFIYIFQLKKYLLNRLIIWPKKEIVLWEVEHLLWTQFFWGLCMMEEILYIQLLYSDLTKAVYNKCRCPSSVFLMRAVFLILFFGTSLYTTRNSKIEELVQRTFF